VHQNVWHALATYRICIFWSNSSYTVQKVQLYQLMFWSSSSYTIPKAGVIKISIKSELATF
jgi:arginine decarboxylase-like protein